jgi:hypothetical protein
MLYFIRIALVMVSLHSKRAQRLTLIIEADIDITKKKKKRKKEIKKGQKRRRKGRKKEGREGGRRGRRGRGRGRGRGSNAAMLECDLSMNSLVSWPTV